LLGKGGKEEKYLAEPSSKKKERALEVLVETSGIKVPSFE